MSSSKRFPPTARKIKKTKEQGDIPKSCRLSSLVIFGAVIFLEKYLRPLCVNIMLLLQKMFSSEGDFNIESMLLLANEFARLSAVFCLLLFFVVFIVGFLVESAQCTPKLHWSRVIPKIRHLNLVDNFQRIVGIRSGKFEFWSGITGGFVRVLFAFITVLGVIGFKIYYGMFIEIGDADVDLIQQVDYLWNFFMNLLTNFALIGFVYGSLDYVIQRQNWLNRLGMTREEVKKEIKENDGNPEINSYRKYLHQEIVQSELIENVKRAHVLVVNK